MAKNIQALNNFKDNLSKEYNMKDLKEIKIIIN